jgi:sigma-B regulation protein RsbU (phosphoserine phosphatase)
MRVLIAASNLATRRLIEEALRRWQCEVDLTDSGAEALQMLRTDPEIMLLVAERQLGGIDGPELVRRARRLMRPRYLHIMLIAGSRERGEIREGIDAGADALLPKPIEPLDLETQLRVIERLVRLQRRLYDREVELTRRVDELTTAYDRIRNDLSDAARIQRALLPSAPPPIPGIRAAWVFEPGGEVAGDIYNIFRLDEKHVAVFLLDAASHGVAAALLSVSLRQALSADMSSEGILKQRSDSPPYYQLTPPADVVNYLNERFPNLAREEQFFSLLYGLLNHETGEFRFVRAGRPGVVVSHGDTVSRVEDGCGPPIGVVEDAEFEEQRLTLEAGDRVVIYSDGLPEARNTEFEEFGNERILRAISSQRSEPLERALLVLKNRVASFGGGERLQDDLTVIGLEREG